MEQKEAIRILNDLIARGNQLSPSSAELIERWKLDTAAALERIFGTGSRQLQTFDDIHWFSHVVYGNQHANISADNDARAKGLRRALTVLESSAHEIEQLWEIDRPGKSVEPLQLVARIFNRFHAVAQQLRHRHNGRATLEVKDEFDVQDLLHALLLVDFDDVRQEEPTGSYAGASSRIDFVLKKERMVVEVKRTRRGLTASEIGEQLMIDCQRYKTHRDCGMLVCFVYDPEGYVVNPRGIENDLASAGGEVPVAVFIRP